MVVYIPNTYIIFNIYYMRIKTFKLFEGTQLWEQVPEFGDISDLKRVEFSDGEVERIRLRLGEGNLIILSDDNKVIHIDPEKWVFPRTFVIWKFDDGWYFVSISVWVKSWSRDSDKYWGNRYYPKTAPKGWTISKGEYPPTYYKCDQLDGLLDLLKKVNLLKKEI
jgi:hypothetical protein